jgi:hypothetical protein
MTLVRTVFLALAVLIPTSWTMAKAADPAPSTEGEKDKKDKKAKKEEGGKKEGDKK